MARAIIPLAGEVLSRPKRTDLRLYALGALVGVLAGFLVVVFRTLIGYTEFVFWNATGPRLVNEIIEHSWARRLIAPIVGGILIAIILRIGISLGWGPSPRPFGLNDTINARRLRTPIRATTLSLRDSLLSMLATIISLGSGASAGREGSAAHAGASLGMLPGRLLGLDIPTRRLLIAMGMAAGLAAALHAPIAATLLTRETMLRKHRLTLLGPIAMASFLGWLTARALLGDNPILTIPTPETIPTNLHLIALALTPLFALIAWATTTFWRWVPPTIESLAHRYGIPVWLLPVFGGLLLGLICLAFPPVMGIGFGPLAASLTGTAYTWPLMLVLLLAKIVATGVTTSFRFGGSLIAPALFIGAMLGATSGIIATLIFPEATGAPVFLGLIAMAATIAVLLEAPIFAGVLILELSPDISIAAASLACAFLAHALTKRFAPKIEIPSSPTGHQLG